MQLETFLHQMAARKERHSSLAAKKINLHDAKAPYVPHAKNSIQRAIDLCFITDTPIQDWIERFELYKIPIESGPVEKTEATGPIMSVYIRDPDENLIEISNKI